MNDANKLLKTFVDFHKNKYCDSKIGDKGNKILYDLCKQYPGHTNESDIRAKIWLIGRSYSVAIERRKKFRKMSNDTFYSKVTQEMAKLDLDELIKKIPKEDKLNERNVEIICYVHSYLTKKFKELTGLDKRSLASKYLHFHRSLVPIYDSRAKKSMGKIFKEYGLRERHEKNLLSKKYDKEYKAFVEKIFCLQSLLDKKCKKCTMRDIDKYLMWKAEYNQ